MQDSRIQRRIRAYQHQRRKIQSRINLLATFRFIVFIGLVLGISLLFGGDYQVYGAVGALTFAGVFIYLMVIQDRCYRFKAKCDILIDLSKDDSARVRYAFQELGDERVIRFPDDHPFAHDLDLNQPNSLLKLLDDSFHDATKQRLRTMIDEADPVPVIRERQQAIDELSGRKRLRLKIALAARQDSTESLSAADMNEWLQTAKPWTLNLGPYIFGRILAACTTSAVVARFFMQIEASPWIPLLLFQVIVFYGFETVHRYFCMTFMQRRRQVAAACAVIASYERAQFDAARLRALQDRLRVKNRLAAPSLKKLLRLNEMLAYRENGFAHLFLNGLFMWDQHYLRKLWLWREAHGDVLPDWIDTIFEIEALTAPANYRWLYPERPFPEVVEADTVELQAVDMAHPTIAEDQRIGNDYTLNGDGIIHLITGSNMSGKSTFLRTIGLNLIAARIGAPVCAQSMRCGTPRLWTSIRIQDSLASGVSYFYAEVRRIKAILDAVAEDGPPVLFLMDEVLKGTNSRERLIACKAMVAYLLQHRAAGLITTHDLELLQLATRHEGQVFNYHFRELVEHEEMFFDYQLRTGHLTSTNALRVMKLADVPLTFEDDA